MAELLVSLRDVTKAFGAAPLFESLSLGVFEGDHVGLVGPNGSGKTTLLRMIVGELPPDAGTIETAEHLRAVYFEQTRESLDPGATLRRALAPDGDSVINPHGRGQPSLLPQLGSG